MHLPQLTSSASSNATPAAPETLSSQATTPNQIRPLVTCAKTLSSPLTATQRPASCRPAQLPSRALATCWDVAIEKTGTHL